MRYRRMRVSFLGQRAGCGTPGALGWITVFVALGLLGRPCAPSERCGIARSIEGPGPGPARATVPPQDPTAQGPGDIRSKLTGLLVRELDEAQRLVNRSRTLMRMGKTSEAKAAMEAASRTLSAIRRGFRWMRELGPRWEKEVPYFSLVRVRIVRSVPSSERLFENDPEPPFRALGRVLGKLTAFDQDIDAEILEVQAIGKAYPPWSIKGRLHPSRKRSDIRVGRKIELSNNALETRIRINKTHQGQEFWLVISPPMAIKGIPRLVGGVGRSNILFALPARKR